MRSLYEIYHLEYKARDGETRIEKHPCDNCHETGSVTTTLYRDNLDNSKIWYILCEMCGWERIEK